MNSKENPEPWMIEEAKRILAACLDEVFHARIDVVQENGELIVMEVELIEPYFYAHLEENFSQNLFLAILSRLSG